jgi:twitching motility protein PilT
MRDFPLWATGADADASHMTPDPQSPSLDLAVALERTVAEGASDLHLKAGNRPLIRVHGQLSPLDIDAQPLTASDTEQALHSLLGTARMAEFERRHEVDFGYTAPGLARFRVNAYRQRGTIAIVLRTISDAVRTIDELGLPEVVRTLAEQERGIVLVTGATGSGKSTTVAAMLEHINITMSKHIVTIEDPIEYVFHDKRASIDQREVGADTESFRTALRQVMRQDPDVIFIGEMRDAETVGTALSAAETGHLVLSTLHTADAAETMNRITDFFAPADQARVRAMIAGNLKGVVSQRLVPAIDESDRVAVTEVLAMSGRVHDIIRDSSDNRQLHRVIAEGDFYGMHTFDQSLYASLTKGLVSLDVAMRHASHPHELKLLVATRGNLKTTMADVGQEAPAETIRPESVAPPGDAPAAAEPGADV